MSLNKFVGGLTVPSGIAEVTEDVKMRAQEVRLKCKAERLEAEARCNNRQAKTSATVRMAVMPAGGSSTSLCEHRP